MLSRRIIHKVVRYSLYIYIRYVIKAVCFCGIKKENVWLGLDGHNCPEKIAVFNVERMLLGKKLIRVMKDGALETI